MRAIIFNMTVLYFGVYDPNYARNWVLINSLKRNGVEVVECREKPKRFSFFRLALRYFKLRKNFKTVIVGFPGQEVMFLARLLMPTKTIIFDAFTSHYGGYILDRRKYPEGSIMAKYYRFLDRWSCRLANMVLLDTQAHINFFVEEFGLPQSKFRRIFAGSNTDIFFPRETIRKNDHFLVHFHGYYAPLQGIEYIIRAAKILEKESIVFNIIGEGQTYRDNRLLAEKLGVLNINFISRVSYTALSDYIAGSDICLGIFGNTQKTGLVIPNKVYEAVAAKKPVITADTPAIRELFDNDCMLLIKQADPEALAEAILKLKNDFNLAKKLAQNSYDKFLGLASLKVIGEQLRQYL